MTAILRDKDVHVAWAGDARCIVFRRVNGQLVAVPLIEPQNPEGVRLSVCSDFYNFFTIFK